MGSFIQTLAFCATTAASGNVNGLVAIITLHYTANLREGQHLLLKLAPGPNSILLWYLV